MHKNFLYRMHLNNDLLSTSEW